MTDLLQDAYQRALRYQASLPTRPVFPDPSMLAGLTAFDETLPATPQDASATLELLDQIGSPATVASTGGNYFGFVTGGALPVTQAAHWLATIWDQNGALYMTSPLIAHLETVVRGWLIDLFNLPSTSEAAFVTGATMANFSALAAARHALLARAGWNVEEDGLFGAPEIKVVVSAEIHVSILKALSLVGFGRGRLIRVPVDAQGRMLADQLPSLDEMTLVCVQAGNVNSGSFDPIGAVCEQARSAGAWVHVDGAFGMWASASPRLSALTTGIEQADSWTLDAHKWLNIPYDGGIAMVKDGDALRASMSTTAAYLTPSAHREPAYTVPEFSRRGRVIDIWSALRTLGRSGLANLIEQHCAFAQRFASALQQAGYTVHNDVVLNQVVVSFGPPEVTTKVIQAVQAEGTLWAGQTLWQGQTAMRISISGWATTADDIERSIQALLSTARQITHQ